MTTTEQKLREAKAALTEFNRYFTCGGAPTSNDRITVRTSDWRDLQAALLSVFEAIALPPTPVQMPEAMTDELKPVGPHDHPGHHMVWTPLELRWIAARDAIWAERLRAANSETTRIVALLDAANDELKRLRAVQGEPVAWIRRHPNGALSNELLIHVQVEQVRRDSGAWVPLYTHPAPGVPDDAKRLNWLDDTNKRFRMGWEVGQAPAGNVSIRTIITGGKSIRDAIDAAMLTAAQAKDGGKA